MNYWFDVEKIDNFTYAISEYKHWEKVHSYLLIGEEKACLIDTGLGIENIKEIIDSITELPIIVINTHVHWDHIGGNKYFSEIYVHRNDAEWLKYGIPIPLEVIRKNVLGNQDEKTNLPDKFNIDDYYIFKGKPKKELKDGDEIELGKRKLKIIHTPGHSPGHICVYEEDKGYIYTGDLIYEGILFAFYPSTDPALFYDSIKKISKIEKINRILSGHNKLNLKVSIIKEIEEAFEELNKMGLLKHGSGIHDFGKFKIQI